MRYNDTYVKHHTMTKKKLINTNYFSKSLFEAARNTLGQTFDRLPDRIQTGYASLFYNHHSIFKKNQHNKDSESMTIDADEMCQYFRDQRLFNAVNTNGYWLRLKRTVHGAREEKYALTTVPKYGFGSIVFPNQPTEWVVKTFNAYEGMFGKKGHTNGYKLSPSIQHMATQWLNDTLEGNNDCHDIVNKNGQSIKDFDSNHNGAIVRNESSVSETINVNTLVRVNLEELMTCKATLESLHNKIKRNNVTIVKVDTDLHRQLIYEITAERQGQGEQTGIGGAKVKLSQSKFIETLASKDIEASKIIQQINEINQIMVVSKDLESDYFYVIYNECGTGRYCALNGNLQSYSQAVRYAALKGCFEYDLEAAHQNILLQTLKHFDIDFPETDVVYEYVKNKKDVRIRLSNELGISVKMVKAILQALTYGARLTKDSRRAIYKITDANAKGMEKVVHNAWLQRYMEAFKLISKALSKHDIGSVNAVGIKFVKDKDSQRMAHVLQGFERQVIDAVIKHSNRNNIALLVHDCIVFYNKVDTGWLNEIVKQETGFDLEFSENRY